MDGKLFYVYTPNYIQFTSKRFVRFCFILCYCYQFYKITLPLLDWYSRISFCPVIKVHSYICFF